MSGCRRKGEINTNEAAAIAKQQAFRRGWKDIDVISSKLEGERWIVELERLPSTPGGHATVEISTKGEVLRYIPGK